MVPYTRLTGLRHEQPQHCFHKHEILAATLCIRTTWRTASATLRMSRLLLSQDATATSFATHRVRTSISFRPRTDGGDVDDRRPRFPQASSQLHNGGQERTLSLLGGASWLPCSPSIVTPLAHFCPCVLVLFFSFVLLVYYILWPCTLNIPAILREPLLRALSVQITLTSIVALVHLYLSCLFSSGRRRWSSSLFQCLFLAFSD